MYGQLLSGSSLLIPTPFTADWATLALANGAGWYKQSSDLCSCFAGDSGFADSNSLEITGERGAGMAGVEGTAVRALRPAL